MPSKLQFYSEFAERTARQITGSYQSWTAFLATAARLYKYPYNEQLMIYAQRPNATACAEYDFWKDRMGRYVQRGSTGIALIDTSGYQPRLRYVFDVADTAPRDAARNFTLWEMRTEHIAMFLWMQRTKMTWLISTLVMKSLSITMVTLQRAIHYRSIRCMRFL